MRAIRVAAAVGIDIARGRARRVAIADFGRCDLILAMDKGNFHDLTAKCPEAYRHKVRLVLEIVPDCELAEVPDPYYGSLEGFRRVHELLDEATLTWAQQMARPDSAFEALLPL